MIKMKRILPVLIFSLLFSVPAFGQAEEKETSALKIKTPIKVDGFLNEQIWESAPETGDFIQFEPRRGEAASEKTVVKILYDENFIYFGFLCYEPKPEKIAARITKRDAGLHDDDAVGVFLDTFHDRRSCYFFITNLLGTQLDGRITENGRTRETTWDGIWKSAGKRTEFGWSAEIAVDLSCLKYEPGKNKTWGLNLGRPVPRVLEKSFWVGPLESPYKVSQYGILMGLDLPRSEKKSQIIPHIISKIEERKPSEIEGGLDVRYAFSQAVSGNLTVNPDFATVEADQEQINLTRFELSLSEKRNFFLEGSEIFRQRIRLFYSRRISDIYGGAKVYGKSGGFEFSGLSAQTKKSDEGSANFTVFRLKKDVMKSSTIGFLAANKLVGGKNWGTAGIDTSLYFTDTFKFTGQLALGYSDDNKDDIAFFLRPSYDSATFHIHIRYTQLGRNFRDNADKVGFIRDDNRRELDSAVTKTFWLKKWGFDRIKYSSNYNIYWGLDGTLRSWKIDEGLSFDLQSKFSLNIEHTQEFKGQDDEFFEEDFRNHRTEFELGYNTREWQHVRIFYEFGRNFDSDYHRIKYGLNYKITKNFALQYSLDRLKKDPDPEKKESKWIHVIRATNYFTNDLFIKLFFQTNSAIEKENIQVVFVYRFQPPFGLIQLAYQKGTAKRGEIGAQGDTLFLKIAYMF
ncbi:MAG: carbohydrate binding family 9 domain-containing protein [Candidatus Aminicenantes bacterium]|nr:carbohydrate binding family 9 domain-containing protein [Candidatus Aminicenantes bacterium]